jgi:hypothetical protein
MNIIDEVTEIQIRKLFGERACRIPLNFVTQEADRENGQYLVLAQTTLPAEAQTKLTPTQHPHHLVMGEAVIRPHLIIASEHLIGAGASGIITGGFHLEDWVRRGTVLYDPLHRVS